MDRFNILMDDTKEALNLSLENKGLFLPALIANIVVFVLGIFMVVFIIASIVGSIGVLRNSAGIGTKLAMVSGIIIAIIVVLLIFTIIFMALDIGITGLVIDVVDGNKPTAATFFHAIKSNLLPVLLTNLGLLVLYFLGFILLLIPLVIYLLTVGILTGGWGMIFLSCVMQTLLGYWVLIKMEDQRGGFESIGVNIKFGRKHFWLMVLIFYMQLSFAAYLPGLLGLLGAALASFFISYVVVTFYKIILLKTYRRYREDLEL